VLKNAIPSREAAERGQPSARQKALDRARSETWSATTLTLPGSAMAAFLPGRAGDP